MGKGRRSLPGMHVHVHSHVHRHVDGHGGGCGTVGTRTWDRRAQILHVVLRVMVRRGGAGASGVIAGRWASRMHHRMFQG